jgi:hypothetical protein
MDWVTVATFTYPTELLVLRSMLEAEGIQCFAKDENTLQVQPFYSNAIGGVKLQVAQKDFIKAKKIAEEYHKNIQNANPPELTEEEYMQDDVKNKKGEIVCPVCGSSDVRVKGPSRLNLISPILGILDIFPSRKYHCFKCGHNFTPAK